MDPLSLSLIVGLISICPWVYVKMIRLGSES